MSKLTITRGYPGSGKTTFALDLLKKNPGMVRVNRDAIRLEFFGGYAGVLKWEDEKLVTEIAKFSVNLAMAARKYVIIDDMHLNPLYIKEWMNLAFNRGYEFEVVDFDVPYAELLHRNQIRESLGQRFVPREVLEEMFARNPNPFVPIEI